MRRISTGVRATDEENWPLKNGEREHTDEIKLASLKAAKTKKRKDSDQPDSIRLQQALNTPIKYKSSPTVGPITQGNGLEVGVSLNGIHSQNQVQDISNAVPQKTKGLRPPPINTTLPKQPLRKPALVEVPTPQRVSAATAGFPRRIDEDVDLLARMDYLCEQTMDCFISCCVQGRVLLVNHLRYVIMVVACSLAIALASVIWSLDLWNPGPSAYVTTSSMVQNIVRDDHAKFITKRSSSIGPILLASIAIVLLVVVSGVWFTRHQSRSRSSSTVRKVNADSVLDKVLSDAKASYPTGALSPTKQQREWAIRAIAASPNNVHNAV